MKRVVVLLAVLSGAAAGAYAQDALQKEPPSSTSTVWPGVIYGASTCSGDHTPGTVEFYFRETRQLEGQWIETDYAWGLTREYSRYEFKPIATPVRLNLEHLCSIQIATLNQ